MSVFIIAEAGINHNGDMAAAFKLIDAAQTAGADAVKFQTYDCELLEPPGERRELLRKCQLTHDQFRQLKDHADSVGIEFMSTPFDVGSLEFLVSLGVKRLKISSGDLTNYELLEAANAAGLPAIVSTGMAEDDDIAAALGILYDATLLHCVSAYPTPVEEANLGAMVDLTYFGFPVGISDHSGRWHLPAYAVAAGASVIEVHIRLSGFDCPDLAVSLSGPDFIGMVNNVRWVEKIMGHGIKRPMPCEAKTMQVVAERKAWRERK